MDGKLFAFPQFEFGWCPASGPDDDGMFSVRLEGIHRDAECPGAG